MPAPGPISCPRPRQIRDRSWTVAPIPPDLQDRRVEITGPRRPQDGHQRAQLRREGVHGRLRGCQLADLGEHHPGADQPAGCRSAARSTLRQPRGQAVRAERRRPPSLLVRPRGWHLPEKHVLIDGQPISGAPVRLRPVLLPQRQEPCSPRAAARTSTCRSWRATWRRGCGTMSSCWRSRNWASRRARSARRC